jgi:hypothetical protein
MTTTTLTHAQQRAALRKAIAAFLRHQQAATAALQAVTAIALCETEGNPLDSALRGEDAVLGYANATGDLCGTIEAAEQALRASGHIV